MSKVLSFVVVLLMVFCVPAFAVLGGGIDDSIHNTAVADADASSRSTAEASSHSTAVSSQWMAAVNESSMFSCIKDGDTAQTTDVRVEGEENKSYFYGAPSLSAAPGSNGFAAGNGLLGSVSVVNTDRYQILSTATGIMKTLVDGQIAQPKDDNIVALAKDVISGMREEVKPNRFLGCCWKTSGCNLASGLSLLSWRTMRPSENK